MYLRWTRRTRTFNVSVLSIQKRTMNKNLCQLCPNIMPTIIVTVGQRWANIILKIFWRWANVAPTCWANVGTLCTYNVGPTLKANVGPTKWTTLAQRWANVCVLSGLTATFYLNMMISAMWFNANSSYDVEYKINIGPLSVSYLQLYVGTIALGISLPCVALLKLIFRHRRMKEETVQFVHVRSRKYLPHWIHYVGYVVCFLVIICGFLFTFFYSLQWGGEISNNWLMSIFFGTMFEASAGPVQVWVEERNTFLVKKQNQIHSISLFTAYTV